MKAAFWPMGRKRKKFPYKDGEVLLDLRPTSTTDIKGTIEILAAGRYKLELEAAGGSGSGWQDGNVWSGGGSGAAIVVEIWLRPGRYNYSAPGKTNASGYWTAGGHGRQAYFKTENTDNEVYFKVNGGGGQYGVRKNDGGAISTFSVDCVLKTIHKKVGNSCQGWSSTPGASNPGAASVYPVDGVQFGAGGSTNNAGMQGFLRLTFLRK